jgi:hypothetical protein
LDQRETSRTVRLSHIAEFKDNQTVGWVINMATIELATAKVVRTGKRDFGFLGLPDGTELHFSLFVGRKLTPDGKGFTLKGEPRKPKVGDRIIYRLARNEKGPTANPWAFAPDVIEGEG